MPKKETTAPKISADSWPVFASMAGVFFFITFNKLSTPVVIDRTVVPPQDLASAFNFPWPPHWGVLLFVPVALVGLFGIEWKQVKFHWAAALPLLWLGWVVVSASQTVRPDLTKLTLTHFAICVGLFYLGFLARNGMSNPWPLWAGLGLALCWAMRAGMEQHFGGLEATRKMFAESPELLGVTPEMKADPDYLARLNGNRIFGTMGNPNTLAGGVVLLMPLTLVFLWRLTPKVRESIRVLFVLVLGGCGLACLYWSRSKAGWLVALAVGLVALGHSGLPLKWRRWVIYGVLVLGLAGFAFKYAGYFRKERNSLGARFGYWRVALIIIDHHPLLGTGPGTFQVPYAKLKHPGDEMARLCHNDYLEQGTDSGIPGLIFYSGMILTFLVILYRYTIQNTPLNWLNFAVWLGIFGLCLHCLVDFHLYVASLAWPMFFLCGWLMSRNN